MLSKNKKNNRAFTLVELMAAMVVISIGLVGVGNIITQILVQSRYISSKLVAAYLAQEGLEIVRNIRDTNWLTPGNQWNSNLIGDGTGTVQYDSSAVNFGPNSIDDTGARLKLDPTNQFYNHTTGVDTPFYRLITISQISPTELEVKCQVKWIDMGIAHTVTAVEDLYKWR